MGRSKIFFIFLISVLWLIFSCNIGLADETGKSFLWEITHKNQKSYILGSVHLLKKEFYPLKPVIEKSFNECDVLVVEANISSDKMGSLDPLIILKAVYSGEKTLKDSISKEIYELTQKRMKKYGVDIEIFQKFKPWFLGLTMMTLELNKIGFDPNYGIDKYFLDKASNKKEILELESIEYQLSLFDSLTPKESEQFLFSAIEDTKNYHEEMGKMVEYWKNGDSDSLGKILTKNERKYPELRGLFKRIVDERNFNMVEKIGEYLNTGKRYFIVVGALHLVGKNGIIELLKKKGVSLRQH